MKPTVNMGSHWNCGTCGCSWNSYQEAINCLHGSKFLKEEDKQELLDDISVIAAQIRDMLYDDIITEDSELFKACQKVLCDKMNQYIWLDENR